MGHLFTKANASQMAAKGNAIKWSADSRAAKFAQKRAAENARDDDDTYQEKRKLRVRAQLDLIDRRLLVERDPAKIDRLASATARLSDQEFDLTGRVRPGTFKPRSRSKPASRSSPTPSSPATESPADIISLPDTQVG
jgi:hypothetical protein